MGHPTREHWRSRLGVFFATSGSAIGLGTLWKLPYMVGQGGGGAFIIMFLAFTVVFGIPLFAAELLLGKMYQMGIVGLFARVGPKPGSLSAFGWVGVASTLLIAGWYGVVSGWGINYLFMALTDGFKGKSTEDFREVFRTFQSSGELNILWQVMFVALTCTILAKGVQKGIEKYSEVFFTMLFLVVVGLFVYATTLKGFAEAFTYIIAPDFSKITSATIIGALGLSLFTLSLGQGIMVTYGSYLSPQESIFKTVFIVSLSVIILSIIISLMIFPFVFTFGFPPESGQSLLFITMPYVTEQLPGSTAISVLFFILLIFAALTSYIGQLEVLVASAMETWGVSRHKAALGAGAVCFIMGIPVALMNSPYNPFPTFQAVFHRSYLDMSNVIIDWLLIVFSLGVCLVVGYKLPREECAKVLKVSKDGPAFFTFMVLIRILVPAGIALVALSSFGLFGI